MWSTSPAMALTTLLTDDRLLALLNDTMNTDEMQLFLQSTKTYLTYGDDYTAFVVDLDDVYQWMGFPTKGNAKRLLTQNFKIDVDFKANLLLPPQQQVLTHGGHNLFLSKEKQVLTHGGHNKQTIMMTINTFKEMCILANTPKAKQVRMYYLKMERVVQKYVAHQLADTIKREKDTIKRVQDVMVRLAMAERVNTALANAKGVRNRRKYAQGNYVYIVEIHGANNSIRFKVGMTCNPDSRLEQYMTHTHDETVMVHVCPCTNMEMLEKLLHYMLDAGRTTRAEDVFDLPKDDIIQVMDATQQFIDGVRLYHNVATTVNLRDKVRSIIDEMRAQHFATAAAPQVEPINEPVDPEEDQPVQQAAEEVVQEEPVEAEPVHRKFVSARKRAELKAQRVADAATAAAAAPGVAPVVPVPVKNPDNFEGFVAECFEIAPEYEVAFVDVRCRFRLWSRSTETEPTMRLKAYLKTKHTFTKVYVPEVFSELEGFRGLRIKPPVPITLGPDPSDVERFMHTCAEASHVGRILQLNLYQAFEKWRGPTYKMTKHDRTALREHMHATFMSAIMNRCVTGRDGMATGYFGVKLKDDPTERGLSLNFERKKPVEKVNPTTNLVVEKYMSLAHAAHVAGIEATNLCKRIKGGQLQGGFVYRYVVV